MLKEIIKDGLKKAIDFKFAREHFSVARNRKIFKFWLLSWFILQLYQTTFRPIYFIRLDRAKFGLHLFLFSCSYFVYIIFINKFGHIINKKEVVEFKEDAVEENVLDKTYLLANYIDNLDTQDLDVPCVFGMGKHGNIIVKDAAKFPHALVMGATGSGKSVFINSLIQSIMYFNNNVLFVGTDFKKIELNQYMLFDNFIFIDSLLEFSKIMENIEKEVTRRALLFQFVDAKNLKAYNQIADADLPYIVLIIDECAELELSSDKKLVAKVKDLVVSSINRWRAYGIICILCLQRAIGEQLNTSTRAQLTQKICFPVAPSDSQFMDMKPDDIKDLQNGVARSKNGSVEDIFKSLLVESSTFSKNFSNEVYEKIYEKNVGEKYKYYNCNNYKYLKSIPIGKNFNGKNTTENVKNLRDFLMDTCLDSLGWQVGRQKIKTPKSDVFLEKRSAILENIDNNTISRFYDFLLKHCNDGDYIPSREVGTRKLEIARKTWYTLANLGHEQGFLYKENDTKNARYKFKRRD